MTFQFSMNKFHLQNMDHFIIIREESAEQGDLKVIAINYNLIARKFYFNRFGGLRNSTHRSVHLLLGY